MRDPDFIDKNRKLIPRWHLFSMARATGVVTSLNPISFKEEASGPSHLKREYDFIKRTESIPHASDFVCSALVLDDYSNEDAAIAAEFLFSNVKNVSHMAREVANNFLISSGRKQAAAPKIEIPENKTSYFPNIASLRKELIDYPNNPVKWTDLAYYYSLLGQTRQAEHCIGIAQNMGRGNRFILLSAARFYVHINRPDMALDILRKHPNARFDPWLVSSEIAISEMCEEKSRRVKDGLMLVNDHNIHPFQLSELAGSLGTMELMSGAVQKGKKLFRRAAESPTENTIAQIVCLGNELGEAFAMNHLTHVPPFIYEAYARYHYAKGEFDKAYDKAREWVKYEPFSSVPAHCISFIAALTLKHVDEAINILRLALLSSPTNFSLNNNLAYFLLTQNDLPGAEQIIKKIDAESLGESEKSVLLATMGAYAFRSGNPDEGRLLYGEAEKAFKRKHDDKRRAFLAKMFYLREEINIGNRGVATQISQLREDGIKAGYPEACLLETWNM